MRKLFAITLRALWGMGLGSSLASHAVAGSWEIGWSFDAPSRQTNGLSFDGRHLWHSHDTRGILYQIDPFSGRVVKEVASTVPEQGDLEWAGGKLFIVDENKHIIHIVDPKSGKTLDTIWVNGIPVGPRWPGSRDSVQMEGLTFDGRHIWVDGGTNLIVRIDPETHKQWMYEMPLEMGYLDGMTWAFDNLWVVTNNATIYELDPCSMKILDRFDAPASAGAGPEGFAFDGENLWFADNQLDKIYKIILKDKLLTKKAVMAKPSACNSGKPVTTRPATYPDEEEENEPPVHLFLTRHPWPSPSLLQSKRTLASPPISRFGLNGRLFKTKEMQSR